MAVEAMRAAKPSKIYIASDGPRSSAEAVLIEKVRAELRGIDWDCSIRERFSDCNLGCNLGPKTAIDWFFENEEEGIILEDDCIPNQSFFLFCGAMLKRFRYDNEVMSITGTNVTSDIAFSGDYWVSRYPLMWGWATWRRAWQHYDTSLQQWPIMKKRQWLKSLGIGGVKFQLLWASIFDATARLGSKASWWDYQWIFSCWKAGGKTIAPSRNLIVNIGFGDDATHTRDTHDPRISLQHQEFTFPILEPPTLEINFQADRSIAVLWFEESIKGILRWRLKNLGALGVIRSLRAWRKECIKRLSNNLFD